MGVAVDKARCHDMTFGVERLFRDLAVKLADPGNLAVLHTDVAPIARPAGAVHNHAVLDNQVVAHIANPLPFPNPASRDVSMSCRIIWAI